jgi:site-specific recombinase
LLAADYFSAACGPIVIATTFLKFVLTDDPAINQSKLVNTLKQHANCGAGGNMLIVIASRTSDCPGALLAVATR